MIVEVLSILAAKSLLSFCVSRSWPSLICPRFIEHHENVFLVFKKYHYSIGYLLLALAGPLVAQLEAQVTSNFPFV
jgi:hypothetical protein